MTNIDGTNISKCEMMAQLKRYSKIDFSSFWYDLGFVGSFFLVLFQFKKVFENCFFQLLARSWFWWQLVSIQIQLKKVFKNWFPQLLARSWFWRQLFLFNIYLKSIQNCFLRLLFPWRLYRWHKHLKMWNFTLAFRKRGGTDTFLDVFFARLIWAETSYIYIDSITKVFKNWFPHLLARSWFWRQLFFYSTFNLKSIQNWWLRLLFQWRT